jgi:hypothetical protein
VNYSCLFKGNGLPEPVLENKQSTNSFTLFYMVMAIKKIHIGEIISHKLKEEGRTKKWLADKVGCDPSCFCKTLNKNHINTDLLMNICFALNHNFFEYLTSYYIETQENKKKNGK